MQVDPSGDQALPRPTLAPQARAAQDPVNPSWDSLDGDDLSRELQNLIERAISSGIAAGLQQQAAQSLASDQCKSSRPSSSQAHPPPAPPDFSQALQLLTVDPPVVALASPTFLVAKDVAGNLKADDRKAEMTLRKMFQSVAWAIKAAASASFFNLTAILWMEKIQERIPPEDVRLHQDLNKLVAVAQFLADATLNAMKFPTWNLPTVLRTLMAEPFEPLRMVSLKLLTLKVVFFVAITSARRLYFQIFDQIRLGNVNSSGTVDGVCVYKCLVNKDTEYCRVGKESILITLGYNSALLQFTSHSEYNMFSNTLNSCRNINKEHSVFSQRTEDSSASQYFQFYGCLSQQQNMMQDFVRTATYHRAILQNHTDFKDKIIFCSPGMMFPTFSDIHLAPFSDEQLYMEHYSRANFWYQQCFYGVNLSSLRNAAVDEYFRQPIVDTFDIRILMARTVKYTVSFLEAEEEDLHRVEIPFVFQMMQSGLIHGLAFWFDVAFVGSLVTVWLSTAPTEPLTHWYQVRCLFQTPLFAKEGETLSGEVLFVANKRQSYDIQIVAIVDETGFKSGNVLDLKNPFFR
ncbi:PREDICTED: histone-arginine methyltransferase CARM1-like [Thamnophis sirtalis]|uniref:type I protein arginine methyltransferase n=1 Tax=Thamnophis sirtalis TaxID=35019 RepID=A0A6I9YA81_9SAUR|nr:PREDICTED: histone-arginine methyltransferase CARM1-like [Thamnophis sirtalis]